MRIEPLIEEETLRARVAELADALWRDYADAPLSMLCVLDGARRFSDDLIGHLARRGMTPERIDIRAHRPGDAAEGPVTIEDFDPEGIEGRDVLIVADVADEGPVLRAILDLLALGEPRSARVCALLDKSARRSRDVALAYVGFEIEDAWVIGYGMEVDGEYQELDWIGALRDDRF